MATAVRRADPTVEEALFAHGFDFNFFQAVRLLGLLDPRRKAIGGAAQPAEEIVRFATYIGLTFPASAIQQITREDGERPQMAVNFMTVAGVRGALPAHYAELLVALQFTGDPALADFFDLFNHRLLSLFYKAWEKHHFMIGYEQARRSNDEHSFTQYLFDLIGMGTAHLRGRLRVPDEALLRYAGLFAQQPHSAVALEGILHDYFQVPFAVQQFVGKWFSLEQESLSWLTAGGLHNQLGVGAVAGDAVWNQQARFRVLAGPLTLDQFRRFLPDGEAFATLAELAGYFAGQALECEIQLVLAADQVPWCRLTDGDVDSPRLGWLGWLKTAEFRDHARDAVFTVRR
ncbi:MAG TPA: type VI secretion system baseplate subunit TssG [Verrucomicrobiae bacterium]|jgi:type VI secretion system protein ImpH|nr:type VI secretion system baseplate subunit TssG [Verrucomicrobiae bacterium]